MPPPGLQWVPLQASAQQVGHVHRLPTALITIIFCMQLFSMWHPLGRCVAHDCTANICITNITLLLLHCL